MVGSSLDTLYGLAAFRALLRRGMGIESCIYELSEAGFGEFSRILGEARRMSELGTPLREALLGLSSRRGGDTGYVLSAIADALDSPNPELFLDAAFDRVRGNIMSRQRLAAESLHGFSEAFYLLSFLVPLIASSMIFLVIAAGGLSSIVGIPYVEPGTLARATLITLASLLSLVVLAAWWRSR